MADVLEDMHVSDSIDFGSQKLIYALQGSEVEEIKASFNGDFITVDVPKNELLKWAGDDEMISMKNQQNLPEGRVLDLLIEKDFACLTREGEEDKFPNPHGSLG